MKIELVVKKRIKFAGKLRKPGRKDHGNAGRSRILKAMTRVPLGRDSRAGHRNAETSL